jgi:hypothetical protein
MITIWPGRMVCQGVLGVSVKISPSYIWEVEMAHHAMCPIVGKYHVSAPVDYLLQIKSCKKEPTKARWKPTQNVRHNAIITEP